MAKEKYFSEEPDHIAHCPTCRGVILRDAKFDVETAIISFTMRCPHCRRDVEILLDRGSVKIARPAGDAP